ncbi:MAG: V-type ATP synthase subunit B [Betaproteobacteria bacterium]|nr:V-type ATP synthase subunit B [Betaproteobacteria bacterium]
MRPDVYADDSALRLAGPLLFARRSVMAGLGEAVEISGADGLARLGRIAALDEEYVTIEVLESSAGLALENLRIRYRGAPLGFALGPGLLGRVFDGVGRPRDGGPPLAARRERPVAGLPYNPVMREAPREFIETGITAIDLLNSLVRGQKLPIFSGGGLPHDRLAAQIAAHARLRGAQRGFAIVFAGIGVSHETAEFFRATLEASGSLERTVLFLNLASDSSTQRLLAPRFALTAAEYLAFEEGLHVLTILTDMTNYCEALREVSIGLGELPGRKGYPGYLYSDLAAIYERAGRLRGRSGTLTQLPILTMPADDIGHPVPDLSGYITEGQIVLDRELDRRGVFPPVKLLPSLSRLMKDGIGARGTDADHPALANQLYASYARAVQTRVLAAVVGEDGLQDQDRSYLAFGTRFESELLGQSGPRALDESMAIGWRLLRGLPRADLARLDDEQMKRYLEP